MSIVYYISGLLLGLVSTGALVTSLLLIARKLTKSTVSHQICSLLGLLLAIVAIPVMIAYAMEAFIAFYGGNKFEADAMHIRVLSGPYRFIYHFEVASLLLSQLFWIPCIRRSAYAILIFGFLQSVPKLIEVIADISSGQF